MASGAISAEREGTGIAISELPAKRPSHIRFRRDRVGMALLLGARSIIARYPSLVPYISEIFRRLLGVFSLRRRARREYSPFGLAIQPSERSSLMLPKSKI